MKHYKYKRYMPLSFPERTWPNKVIEKAPIWCSVDLRDGNQALEVPMTLEQKLDFFDHLIKIGFKEIEIGFPAASETEYKFTRHLIENNLIPDGVAIQVLTQARPEIIERTYEAVRGAKKAIIHLYNSTSTLQRNVVFRKSRKEIIDLAVYGAKLVKEHAEKDHSGTEYIFEYSPESFSGTEPDFAVEICDAVLDVWQPTAENKAIINLPNTVEMTTPNIYADMVEYYGVNTRWRKETILSVHPHNDRGTAVASTELSLLAGADRVEGTLFGNGERTGNVDVLTLALNMFSQGIDPVLDFSDINSSIEVYERNTGMLVNPRQPYAGALVYTAFSGSHQDAINKGVKALEADGEHALWEVPYLPIDPADVGRSYDPIIRINSQSGKGGMAYILERHFGYRLPKEMQKEYSLLVTDRSDSESRELAFHELLDIFKENYENVTEPMKLLSFDEKTLSEAEVALKVNILYKGEEESLEAVGNGVLDAFNKALCKRFGQKTDICTYSQHALQKESTSRAISYIGIHNGASDKVYYGAGSSRNITKASLRALVSAWNHYFEHK